MSSDCVLNQFLQRSINQFFITLNVTIITLLVLKGSKAPAPKGPSPETSCNVKHSYLLYQFCDLWRYLVPLSPRRLYNCVTVWL